MPLSEALAPLARYPRWINWELRPDPHRPDKPRKVPLSPRTGLACDPTDPANHCTYDDAVATGRAVGFVFMAGDGLWFLDLDNCREGDGWSHLAQDIVRAFGGMAACEVSQSGRGLHLFGWSAVIPDHACKNIPLGMELYHHARFVALTDSGTSGGITHDTSAALAAVAAQFFVKTAASSDVVDWTDGPQEGGGLPDTDDDALIRIMLRSGQRSAGALFNAAHVAFADLWEANAEALGARWPSDRQEPYDGSSVDAALAAQLAYWTAKDCERMLRLMHRSALVRDKWERADYLPRTILGACRTVANVVRPRELQAPLTPGLMATVGEPGAPATIDSPGPPAGAVQPAGRGVGFMAASEQQRFFASCVYVTDLNRVWVPGDGSLQDKARFDITYGGVDFDVRVEGKAEKSAWEAFTRNHYYAPTVASNVCFRPELPSGIVTYDGLVNTYRPVNTPEAPGDVSKWLAHMEKLFPVADDRAIITTWLAATLRSPGAKHQWALVIQGCEGNGKTLLNTVMSFAIGNPYVHVARAASLAKTGMQFNKWVTGKLYICFEEINVSEKRHFLEEIKDIITNRSIAIEGKGMDQATGDNRANLIFFTNHKDAVPVTKENRRYAIFFCAQQSEADLIPQGLDSGYFADLWDWLEGRNAYADLGPQAGLRAVNHWLRHVAHVDARYDPRGQCQRAPVTSSTDAARHESLGTIEQEVLEHVHAGAAGFAGGWISAYHLGQLLERMRMGRMSHAKRRDMLKLLGYVLHPGLPDGRCPAALEGIGQRPRIYVREGHLSLQLPHATAIQHAYETAQKDAMKRVVTGVTGVTHLPA